jgi:hypothetical protein
MTEIGPPRTNVREVYWAFKIETRRGQVGALAQSKHNEKRRVLDHLLNRDSNVWQTRDLSGEADKALETHSEGRSSEN